VSLPRQNKRECCIAGQRRLWVIQTHVRAGHAHESRYACNRDTYLLLLGLGAVALEVCLPILRINVLHSYKTGDCAAKQASVSKNALNGGV